MKSLLSWVRVKKKEKLEKKKYKILKNAAQTKKYKERERNSIFKPCQNHHMKKLNNAEKEYLGNLRNLIRNSLKNRQDQPSKKISRNFNKDKENQAWKAASDTSPSPSLIKKENITWPRRNKMKDTKNN